MSGLFGSPKPPKIQSVSYPTVDPNKEKKRIRGKRSRSTLLTGPLGLTEDAPVRVKTLMGA